MVRVNSAKLLPGIGLAFALGLLLLGILLDIWPIALLGGIVALVALVVLILGIKGRKQTS